jgi:hypothetical protein
MRLILRGDWWDSAVYGRRLFLWDVEGSLRIVDYRKLLAPLLKNVRNEPRADFAIRALFCRNDWVSSTGDRERTSNAAYREFVAECLETVSSDDFIDLTSELNESLVWHGAAPGGFPHGPVELNDFALVIAGADALVAVPDAGRSNASNFGFDVWQIENDSQLPITGLASVAGWVTAAAGDEGLYRFAVQDKSAIEPLKISTKRSDRCYWSGNSLLRTADGGSGELDSELRILNPKTQSESQRQLKAGGHTRVEMPFIGSREGKELFDSPVRASWLRGSALACITKEGEIRERTIEVRGVRAKRDPSFKIKTQHTVGFVPEHRYIEKVAASFHSTLVETDRGLSMITDHGVSSIDFNDLLISWRAPSQSSKNLQLILSAVLPGRVELISLAPLLVTNVPHSRP